MSRFPRPRIVIADCKGKTSLLLSCWRKGDVARNSHRHIDKCVSKHLVNEPCLCLSAWTRGTIEEVMTESQTGDDRGLAIGLDRKGGALDEDDRPARERGRSRGAEGFFLMSLLSLDVLLWRILVRVRQMMVPQTEKLLRSLLSPRPGCAGNSVRQRI